MISISSLKNNGHNKKHWTLGEKTGGQTPVLKNDGACLWDLGDDLAAFEITTPMNTINEAVFTLLEKAIAKVKSDFKGLVIGDDDTNFSAGLDLKRILFLIADNNFEETSRLIRRGQHMAMSLKYAPFPVVPAVSGYAVGGACEWLLHADAVILHQKARVGLVEQKIGLVPGWGGCKEMLCRAINHTKNTAQTISNCEAAFETIANAVVSHTGAVAAQTYKLDNARLINENNGLLPAAEAYCAELAKDYKPPLTPILMIPARAIKDRLGRRIEEAYDKGWIDADTRLIQQHLAGILSGGAIDESIAKDLKIPPLQCSHDDPEHLYGMSQQDLLDREHDSFMALLKKEVTAEKIRAVL